MMTREKMEEEARTRVAERFTNGQRRIATEDDLRAKWGLNNERLHCAMCAHIFTLGEGWRWQYMNSTSPSYGNFIVCDPCDGPDVKERWLAAGKLAYSLYMDEMVLANKVQAAVSEREREIVRQLRELHISNAKDRQRLDVAIDWI